MPRMSQNLPPLRAQLPLPPADPPAPVPPLPVPPGGPDAPPAPMQDPDPDEDVPLPGELPEPPEGDPPDESPVRMRAVLPPEIGGPAGPEPTRFGDWEQKGRCTDF